MLIADPVAILYPEAVPVLYQGIDNLLGMTQMTITETEFAQMKRSNRSEFYRKYVNDFREIKINEVSSRRGSELRWAGDWGAGEPGIRIEG